MAETARRYRFHPLERRGVLIGLQATQVVTLIAGLVVAIVAARTLAGPASAPAAVLILAGCIAGALWPVAGRPLVEWIPIGAMWLARRAGGPITSSDPVAGTIISRDGGTGRERGAGLVEGARGIRRRPRVPAPPGIEVTAALAEPGQPEVGLVRDHRFGAWMAVVPVQGRSFSLLDEADQVQRLEAWRAVLGALGRPGSPLRRVQWVERSGPSGGQGLEVSARQMPEGDPIAAAAQLSYRELIAGAASAQTHDVWVVLSVGGARTARPSSTDIAVLRRELRLLEGQLRIADLRPAPPLDRHDLIRLFAASHSSAAQTRLSDRGPSRCPWPLAADEAWASWRADGGWHVTYWIAEWPRVDVPPDFLSPLLLGSGRRTVSVIMAPVPADKAIREARSARTADLADAELRNRAGFLPSARRDKEAQGVVEREHELADGHCEYRFSGYVTVSATDRSGLEVACAEAEHAAQTAHLELRRLYGRQAEAFTWTLPLARGLA